MQETQFDPGAGKIPQRRKWHPTPVFLLDNAVDREAWRATVHETAKRWTGLSDLTLHLLCFLA